MSLFPINFNVFVSNKSLLKRVPHQNYQSKSLYYLQTKQSSVCQYLGIYPN